MIAPAVPGIDTSQYAAQYELLRSQVIGARCAPDRSDPIGHPRGVGLALLLSEGMPGWLKAVEAVVRASAAVRTPETAGSAISQHPADATAPVLLSGVPRNDLTTLLASLVLSIRSHEHAPSQEGYRSCH